MKKYLFLLILTLGFMSCEGPMGPQGPIGPQGPQGPAGEGGGVNWKIIDLEVNTSDWSLTDFTTGNYFYATLSVPELDEFIYDNGLVECYREFNTGTENKYQMPLPNVQHMEEYDGAQQITYTQTTDYSFGVGFVEIAVTMSDFFLEKNPESMHFLLKLIW